MTGVYDQQFEGISTSTTTIKDDDQGNNNKKEEGRMYTIAKFNDGTYKLYYSNLTVALFISDRIGSDPVK